MNQTALIIGGAALLALMTAGGGRSSASPRGKKELIAPPPAPPRPQGTPDPPRDYAPPASDGAPAFEEVRELQRQLNRFVKTFVYDGSEVELGTDGLFGPSTARMYALVQDYHQDYCPGSYSIGELTGSSTYGNVFSNPDLTRLRSAAADLEFCYEDSIAAWREFGVAPKETY